MMVLDVINWVTERVEVRRLARSVDILTRTIYPCRLSRIPLP